MTIRCGRVLEFIVNRLAADRRECTKVTGTYDQFSPSLVPCSDTMNSEIPKRQHPVRKLFAKLQSICPYPSGVIAVPEQIQGTSFFPGGTGLWFNETRKLPDLPIGGVMVLGHDFHSVAGYEWSRENEAENLKTPTWRHLLPLLARTSIPLERCFFTNVYMGLRVGKATTGRFPGAASPDFVKRCQMFFLLQITTQQPTLILALGGYVPAFLAPLSAQLTPWGCFKSFRERDAHDAALIRGVSFGCSGVQPCVVASLVHPSFRPSNVHRRSWGSFAGDAAEVALLQEAVKRAGVVA